MTNITHVEHVGYFVNMHEQYVLVYILNICLNEEERIFVWLSVLTEINERSFSVSSMLKCQGAQMREALNG